MQDYADLDRIDRAILHEVQLDGRLSNTALAERVNLSESACLRRLRRLRTLLHLVDADDAQVDTRSLRDRRLAAINLLLRML